MPNTASRLITATPKESTRDVLVRTAVALIDEIGEPHLRLETVLQRSGASVSSLYHYFGNLDGLLRAANISRFNRYAFADIEYLRRRTEETESKDDFRMLANQILDILYNEDRRLHRLHRLDTVHHASGSTEFSSEIGALHKSAIEKFAEALDIAKAKGFIKNEVDTTGFAAWFLGNSFARGLLDITDENDLSASWLAAHRAACFHLLGL
jgi:AcrR family transcriptional regulator